MKTFVVAEIGLNHNGSFSMAKSMIDAAKDCGCSAVKFQTYFTESRVSKDSPIYEILKKCELSFDAQQKLKEYADQIGIEWFSTPFCAKALEFLVGIGVKRIKIASFDVVNSDFLKQINETCKINKDLQVIMSTGMSNKKEIHGALSKMSDCDNMALLHCVSAYPTPEDGVNLAAISELRELAYFNGIDIVGYSDHTSGVAAPALSVLAGAMIVEKHFMLDKKIKCADALVSADPEMMKQMIVLIDSYEKMLGRSELCLRSIEQSAEQFRRKS